EFDGVDDYVEIGTNVSSLRLTSALTVSAWIKYRNSSTLYPGIVDATDETVGGSGYLLYLENTTSNYQAKFMLHNNTRYRVESDSELLEGVWYYLVGTFNGSEQLLYVNGIKQSSTNSNAGVNYSSSLHLIGKYDAGGNHYFNGTIDEVRIWNRSLSAEEVAQQYMSNLNKYDSDSWLLYVNQSKNDTTALADGNYTYYASAKDASGNENRTDVWEVQIYSVDTTAPVINLSTPADDTSTTTTSHNFIFNVTDDNEISNCSLIVDNSVSVYNSSAITKSELNTITQTLSAGTHTWNVNCTDASNNIGSSTIYDLIITTPSSSTSSTSSGGGSGGGGGGTVSSTRKTGFRVSPSEINEKMVVREAKSVKMNVENTGDMKVVVVLSMGELKDIVFVSENEFQLGVDETREIELNIIAPDEAGIYAGFLRFEGSDGSVHEVPIAINVRSGKFLFDTSISVLADVVSLGNVLMTHVNLIEVGRNEKLDVTANYIIRDYQGKTYYESSDTFFVEGDKEYDKEFSLAGLPEGKYLVGVELVYPDGIATSSASFQIVRDEFNIRMLILIGLGVLMFGVIILVVMMVRRRRKIRRKK
ncbi:MAG: LamG domain-containing protein, partial [Nanoarchaeota archaeon]|nr:LamG domain-containing protein [Nanoarchaeota archaeon]